VDQEIGAVTRYLFLPLVKALSGLGLNPLAVCKIMKIVRLINFWGKPLDI
jgi:hypothetical protein